MSRRSVFGMMAGASVVAVTGAAVLAPGGTGAAGGTMTVIEELSLLAEPDESADVLAVLQPGDEVYDQGEVLTNGYRLVASGKDTVGWAPDSGLRPGNADPDDPFADHRYLARGDGDVLRESPAMNSDEVVFVPFAALLGISDQVEGPYRYAGYSTSEGVFTGWITNAWLAGEGTGVYAVSLPDDFTSPVPLFEEPSASADVIAEIPSGDQVLDYDGEVVDGYLQVDWKGTIGWVAEEHLGRG